MDASPSLRITTLASAVARSIIVIRMFLEHIENTSNYQTREYATPVVCSLSAGSAFV